MDPKEQFMHKMAALAAEIPEEMLDQEIYQKYARDVKGGIIAGRACMSSVSELQEKMALAQQVRASQRPTLEALLG